MISRIIAYFCSFIGTALIALSFYIVLPSLRIIDMNLLLFSTITLIWGLVVNIISYLIWKATQKDGWQIFPFF